MSISKVNKIFAKNMKLRRVQLELSQEKLGELSGLHRTYIGGIEQFVRNPSVKSMEKIAKALKTDVALLTNKNFEEIMNGDYSLCHFDGKNYNFKTISSEDIAPKYLKMLDDLCNE